MQPRVRDVLRLGAHQLLGMRVEDHAAVSATVDLARARGGPRSAGLVNAVLRRIAADDLDTWLARVAPDETADPVGHARGRAQPPTLGGRGVRRGAGAAGAELARPARGRQPARRGWCWSPDRPVRRRELPGEPTALSPYGVLLAGGDPGAVPAVAQGRAGVQDEGSQLVALALAAAELEGDDRAGSTSAPVPGARRPSSPRSPRAGAPG